MPPQTRTHTYTDTALVWALRLTGIHDRDKFKALDWGLRTWDQWQLNDCDDRFGSDWPGWIPPQLVAHPLYYFSRPGDRVRDPRQTTHRIECPLSTERLTSTQVQRMQSKRILGTIGRTLLIARRT